MSLAIRSSEEVGRHGGNDKAGIEAKVRDGRKRGCRVSRIQLEATHPAGVADAILALSGATGPTRILFGFTKPFFFCTMRGFLRKRIEGFIMYAVIKTGGKQYRVASGEKIKVEQIPADVGSQITLDQVLLVADGDKVSVGAPLVSGANGAGDGRGAWPRRQGHHLQDASPQALSKKHGGHRQNYTEIQIGAISA